MKAPSNTDTSCRRTTWSCAVEDSTQAPPPPPSSWLAIAIFLGVVLLAFIVRALTFEEPATVIRYSLPLDFFEDHSEAQCGNGKRVLNGQCVCANSCDTLREADI